RLLGHTEDALTETLNHYYFVDAHIISDKPQGKYNVKEEHFMSLCYAGHLPGYTMNQNYHGLVFSINTISAELLRSGKTRDDPRQMFYNVEMAPSPDRKNESLLNIKEIPLGNHNYHVNQ
ncbi:GL22418, partial [Drosophila persimilis]